MPNAIDKMKRIKGLKRGKGVQYLLNKAYEILGNPLYIHDRDFNLVANTENIITDDPIWNELIETDTSPMERLEFYKKECFLDAAANSKKITYMASDKLEYDRIFGKIFNKYNIQVCCAFMLACEKPFDTEDDPVLFEAFCDILSKELSKDDYYQEYGRMYLDDLIGKLIDEKIKGQETLYTSRVESIYENLESNLYLVVVDISQLPNRDLELVHVKDLLQKAQPLYKYFIYFDYILIIASTENPALDIYGHSFNKLNRLFVKNDLYAGMSSSFENLFELRKYYHQAVEALKFGRENINKRHFFSYNEVEKNTLNSEKRPLE